MSKKAIIFDLDETLRKIDFDKNYKKVVDVRIRPNTKSLFEKLEEAKDEGIDIIIWTTANEESVKKYFLEYIPNKYRELFNRIISKNNKIQIENGSMEERIYGNNCINKPVTALKDYDQILFFDDNQNECTMLKQMYEDDGNIPNKQVVFASYPYNPPDASILYAYKKTAEAHSKYARQVNSLFEKLLEEPGCNLMIEKIEEFKKQNFNKELLIDINNQIMEEYRFEILEMEDEIEGIFYLEKEVYSQYKKYIEDYYSVLNEKNNENIEEGER